MRTETANLASVLAGLKRCDAQGELSVDPERIYSDDHLVLPGVGALAAAMEALHAAELVEALQARVRAGRPTLAICLGMQLLLGGSEESPGVPGLGVVEGHARRFVGEDLLIPQLGWNKVAPERGCALLEPGYAYFANSYRLVDAPEGWSVARTEHGGQFVSAMERGRVLACQFHPELSSAWGLGLLKRWLAC